MRQKPISPVFPEPLLRGNSFKERHKTHLRLNWTAHDRESRRNVAIEK